LGELAEERRAVARAISGLGLTPVLFELGASPHPRGSCTARTWRRAWTKPGRCSTRRSPSAWERTAPPSSPSASARFARLELVDGDANRAALLIGAAEGLRRRRGLRCCAGPIERRLGCC